LRASARAKPSRLDIHSSPPALIDPVVACRMKAIAVGPADGMTSRAGGSTSDG
jgi:hypothetical protein